jgi:hypothetical protein
VIVKMQAQLTGAFSAKNVRVINFQHLKFLVMGGKAVNVSKIGDEICALLGYFAASNNPLPTFRHSVSVPSSRVKNSEKLLGLLDP